MAVSKENPNKGHRKRVREKFFKNGFDGFLDYEILEMLLFYCIPVIDTKELAKNILKKYKTLANVFDASAEELMNIDGVGENSAIFLTMIPKLSKIYETSKWNRMTCLDSIEMLGEYAVSMFKDSKNEEFALICLDANRCVHWSGVIIRGTVDSVEAYPRVVADEALKHNAINVVFTHNHPGGTLAPSMADKNATEALVKVLKGIGIEVLDHIIVSGSRYFSMREMGFKF